MSLTLRALRHPGERRALTPKRVEQTGPRLFALSCPTQQDAVADRVIGSVAELLALV